ncbi:Ankyrin repeat and KH domain-containing protein [Paramyrothecium foliicola]|nr:Ankyrin repeat and KH domain-containing protein [Paramyrothecium foliicola]
MEVVQTYKTGHVSDQEWAHWKNFIRTKYLDENQSLDKIIAGLKRHGMVVTKAQLELKLKKWDFRKNLQPDIWRYVRGVLQNRNASAKKSLVILSGRQIPPEKVEKEAKRNELVRWGPKQWPTCIKGTPSPVKPPGNMPLFICTPRGSSTNLVFETSWPDTLPWNQFSSSHLGVLFVGVRLHEYPHSIMDGTVPASETRRSVARLATQGHLELQGHERSRLFSVAFQYIVNRSLSILMNSESLAAELFAKKSIDRLAASFDAVIPEVNKNRNIERAAMMVSGRQSEILTETVKIIIFLISNRLIMDSEDGSIFLEDCQVLISLCRMSGLTDFTSISRLIDLSSQVPTLRALINAMFDAAVHVAAPDIVSALIRADSGITANTPVTTAWYLQDYLHAKVSKDPLFIAVAQDSVGLVTVLINSGTNFITDVPMPILSLAILGRTKYPSSSMVQFLIDQGIQKMETYGSKCISPLQAAVLIGDYDLIETLVNLGFDLNARYSYDFGENECFAIDCLFKVMEDVGCLGIAASQTNMWQKQGHYDPFDEANDEENEQKALDLCQFILHSFGSRMDLSPRYTADAMILAAGQGFTRLVSFLHQAISAPVDHCNGLISPVYAAVEMGHVSTFQKLMELGASPDIPAANERMLSSPESSFPIPSLLLLAVSNWDDEMMGALLQYGLPAEVTTTFRLVNNDMAWPFRVDSDCTFDEVNETPFRYAIRRKNMQAALELLNHGASCVNSDLVVAAECGHEEVVRQLVARTNEGSDAPTYIESAFRVALSNGHAKIGMLLSENGTKFAEPDLAAIFRVLDVNTLKAIMPRRILASPGTLSLSIDSRSYLENAILSSKIDMIDFALSIDEHFYDAGSLCAAVLLSTRGIFPQENVVVKELLRRRHSKLDARSHDFVLENTAMVMAMTPGCSSVLHLLVESIQPEMIRHGAILLPRPNPSIRREHRLNIDLALYRNIDANVNFGDWPPSFDWKTEEVTFPLFSDQWHNHTFPAISPLLFAVLWRRIDIVTTLMDLGYIPDGFTLRLAILRHLPYQIIERIIRKCPDIEAHCTAGVVTGEPCSPLIIAIQKQNEDIVKCLLDQGANINKEERRCEWGSTLTPLKAAVYADSLDLVCLLLNRGAKVDEPMWSSDRPYEDTALQIAARRGRVGILRALLACKPNIDAPRAIVEGFTALEAAAAFGRLDAVRLLLDLGADTKGWGRFQYMRAFILAAYRSFQAVTNLLLSHRPLTSEDLAMVNEPAMNGRNWINKCEHSPSTFIATVAKLDRRYIDCIWPVAELPKRLLTTRLEVQEWQTVALESAHRWLADFKMACPDLVQKDLDNAATAALQVLEKLAMETGDQISYARVYDDGERKMNAILRILRPDTYAFSHLIQPTIDSKAEETDCILQRALTSVLNALEKWKSRFMAATPIPDRDGNTSPDLMITHSLEWISDNNEFATEELNYSEFQADHSDQVKAEKFQPASVIQKANIDGFEDNFWDRKRELVLKDMLGEEEASFMEVDFLV